MKSEEERKDQQVPLIFQQLRHEEVVSLQAKILRNPKMIRLYILMTLSLYRLLLPNLASSPPLLILSKQSRDFRLTLVKASMTKDLARRQ